MDTGKNQILVESLPRTSKIFMNKLNFKLFLKMKEKEKSEEGNLILWEE